MFSILLTTSFSLSSIFEIKFSIFVVNSTLIFSVSAVSFVSILALTSFMTAANFVIISASELFIISSIFSKLTTGSSSSSTACSEISSDSSPFSAFIFSSILIKSSTTPAECRFSLLPLSYGFVARIYLLSFFLPLFANLRYKSTPIIPIKIAAITIKRKLSIMLKPPIPKI